MDYDIDKLYILSYSLTNDGVIATLSNLQKELYTEDVLNLPLPDGKTYRAAKATHKVVEQLLKNTSVNDNTPHSYENAQVIELNDLVDLRTYRKSWRDNPEKWNSAVSFELKTKPGKYFELVKDEEDGYYSIHFKTSSSNSLTNDEKNILFETVARAIPVGGKLSTWGSLSPGGIAGLARFANLGFTQTGEWRTVTAKDPEAAVKYISNRKDIEEWLNDEGTFTRIPIFEKIEIRGINLGRHIVTNLQEVLRSGNTQIEFTGDYRWNGKELFLSDIEQAANTTNKEKRMNFWNEIQSRSGNRYKAGLDFNRISEIMEIEDDKIRVTQWNNFSSSLSTETTWTAKSDEEKQYERAKSDFLRKVNLHSKSKGKIKGKLKQYGLRNYVVHKAIKVTTNPVNQNNAMNPINMDQQQAAAKRSSLGNDEKEMLLDNPMTKVIMQIQNMVGKEVIGISAVMLKNFFAASCHINTQLDNATEYLKNKQYDKVFETLQLIVFENNFESDTYKPHLATLANTNFDDILEVIKNNNIVLIQITNHEIPEIISSFGDYVSGNMFNVKKLILDLKESSERIDAADSISGLLSAATDRDV